MPSHDPAPSEPDRRENVTLEHFVDRRSDDRQMRRIVVSMIATSPEVDFASEVASARSEVMIGEGSDTVCVSMPSKLLLAHQAKDCQWKRYPADSLNRPPAAHKTHRSIDSPCSSIPHSIGDAATLVLQGLNLLKPHDGRIDASRVLRQRSGRCLFCVFSGA
jgi:hypothetical protein